jgi:hypothetical protein
MVTRGRSRLSGNGPLMARPDGRGPAVSKTFPEADSSELSFYRGAGDGNRIRAISLGIGQIMPADVAGQATRDTRSGRD